MNIIRILTSILCLSFGTATSFADESHPSPSIMSSAVKRVPSLRELGYPTDDQNRGIHQQPIHNPEKFFYDMAKGYGSSQQEQACNWAARPYIYVFSDAVVYVSSDLTNYNVFSHQVVRNQGCRLPQVTYTDTMSFERQVEAPKLQDLGYQLNARQVPIQDAMTFFNDMTKGYQSSQEEQNCAWAVRPNIYVFADGVVYVDSNRSNYNIFTLETSRLFGCFVPHVEWRDNPENPNDWAILTGTIGNNWNYRFEGHDIMTLEQSCYNHVDPMISGIEKITVTFNDLPEVVLFNGTGTWNSREEVCAQIVGHAGKKWNEVFGDHNMPAHCPNGTEAGQIWTSDIFGGMAKYVCSNMGQVVLVSIDCNPGYRPEGTQCVRDHQRKMSYEQCVGIFRSHGISIDIRGPHVQCSCGPIGPNQLRYACTGPDVNASYTIGF